MAADGVGVTLGDSAALSILETGKSGGNHEAFCRYMDEQITLLILGQLASEHRTTGLGSGALQGAVRQDILSADARAVCAWITESILLPLLQMRGGTESAQGSDFTFWIDYETQKDWSAFAQLCAAVAESSGKKLSARWAEQTFGIQFAE